MEPGPALRKTVSASAVLALHVLIVASFVLAMQNTPVVVRGVHEITLMLLPIVAKPKPGIKTLNKRRPPVASSALPTLTRPAHPAEAPRANSFQSLHGLLFDCGPDQILTPEDRKRCQAIAGAPQPDETGRLRNPRERAKDATHWARALARKQAPLLLPCASPYAAGVGIGTLICLGKGVLEGFDLDAQPGYADVQKPWHLPNNGDPVEPRKAIGD